MKLERATAADLPAVAALMNAAFRGMGSNASWNSEAAYIDGDRTTPALLAADVAAQPDGRLLIVRSTEGPIIASVWLEPAGDEVWYLGSLTIAPTLQKAGAGRRLLEAAEQYVRSRGAHRLRMKVVNVRDTLIAWYVRRGYHLTGETEPFPYGDNRFGIPKRDDLSFVVLDKRF